MSDILETSFPTPDSDEQVTDISTEKIGKIIEPEICVVDNTQTIDGVICYV